MLFNLKLLPPPRSASTNSDELHEKLRFYQNATGKANDIINSISVQECVSLSIPGIVPSPFDCYLVNRSLKTLSLRMEQHFANSVAVAKYLEAHPKISKVLHPALPSHPQHQLALSQTFGHSGIMSFYIKDESLEKSSEFLKALKVFTLAESLGGYESLAGKLNILHFPNQLFIFYSTELPSVMTHASVPAQQRKELGITDGLVRISVGLEDSQDLIKDLEQALNAI
jgi:cystathionine gamma-lyase